MHDIRIAAALREHERLDRGTLAMFPAVINFAVEAMKAAALVNGGSAAAMLAFIGTGRQPVTADTILGLKLFGGGLLAAAIATASSYGAQFFYAQDMDSRSRSFDLPFVSLNPRSRRFFRAGVGAHAVSMFLVLGAYVCAVAGLWLVAGSLVTMPAKP